jgi:hypothetical protein
MMTNKDQFFFEMYGLLEDIREAKYTPVYMRNDIGYLLGRIVSSVTPPASNDDLTLSDLVYHHRNAPQAPPALSEDRVRSIVREEIDNLALKLRMRLGAHE